MISRENKKCISKLQKTLYKVELIYYNVYVSYKTLQNITKHGGVRNDKRRNYPKHKETIMNGIV